MVGKKSVRRAREVLRIEAEAVGALAERLDEGFLRAVDIILRCKGRVIVTGMGKPGIIGRKIAATLVSTGTPAASLHPAEAVHGDMGMVVKDDVVIAISNSGETEEVLRLLPMIDKIGAQLVAMTGRRESSLGRRAEAVLDVAVKEEACPLGLVPTASTTAMLAMGDALAVELLERRGFGREDYALCHPGGALGKKLLTVERLLRDGGSTVVVDQKIPVGDVLVQLARCRVAAACVSDGSGRLAGVVSHAEMCRQVSETPQVVRKAVGTLAVQDGPRVRCGELVVEAWKRVQEVAGDPVVVVDAKGVPLGTVDRAALEGAAAGESGGTGDAGKEGRQSRRSGGRPGRRKKS